MNKLPDTKFNGKIVANHHGQLLVRNEAQEQFSVIICPDPKISHVAVIGEAAPARIWSGMHSICFSGKIDQHGGAREVSDLELVASPKALIFKRQTSASMSDK